MALQKNDGSSSSLGNVLIALPVAASALAMCWEVGSFVPIGVDQFSLFSFGEHIIFAYAALPFALLASAILLSYWLGISVPRWILPRRIIRAWLGLRRCLGRYRRRWFYIKFVVLLFVGVALVVVALARRGPTLFFLGAGTIGFAFAFLFPRPTRLMFVTLWSLGFAFGLGIDSTRHELKLKSEEPTPVVNFKTVSKIKSPAVWRLYKSEDKIVSEIQAAPAILIRSGERGALTYDPINKKFFFARWDQIESIESSDLDTFENLPRYLPKHLGDWLQGFLLWAPRRICGVDPSGPENPPFSLGLRWLCK